MKIVVIGGIGGFGGLSPKALRRVIECLTSDSETDVSLAALASEAGLSRFHFCRAFKESTAKTPDPPSA